LKPNEKKEKEGGRRKEKVEKEEGRRRRRWRVPVAQAALMLATAFASIAQISRQTYTRKQSRLRYETRKRKKKRNRRRGILEEVVVEEEEGDGGGGSGSRGGVKEEEWWWWSGGGEEEEEVVVVVERRWRRRRFVINRGKAPTVIETINKKISYIYIIVDKIILSDIDRAENEDEGVGGGAFHEVTSVPIPSSLLSQGNIII